MGARRRDLGRLDDDDPVELETLGEAVRAARRSGRSGSTSPGSASATPRASSAARELGHPLGHRDHRNGREVGDEGDGVLGDLLDEIGGIDAVQVGRIAVGADRPRRRDPGRGPWQQPVRQREDRAREPVAHREVGGLRVVGPPEVLERLLPAARRGRDRWPARGRRARSSSCAGPGGRASAAASARGPAPRRPRRARTGACRPSRSASASSRSGRSCAVHDVAPRRGAGAAAPAPRVEQRRRRRGRAARAA